MGTPFVSLISEFIRSQNFSISVIQRSKSGFTNLVSDTSSAPLHHPLGLDYHHIFFVTLGYRDLYRNSIQCIIEPSMFCQFGIVHGLAYKNFGWARGLLCDLPSSFGFLKTFMLFAHSPVLSMCCYFGFVSLNLHFNINLKHKVGIEGTISLNTKP